MGVREKRNNVYGRFGGAGGAYGNGGGPGGGRGYFGGSSVDNIAGDCGGKGVSFNVGTDQQNECCYNKACHGGVTISALL